MDIIAICGADGEICGKENKQMKQKLIKTTKISPWGTLEKFTIPDATLILE